MSERSDPDKPIPPGATPNAALAQVRHRAEARVAEMLAQNTPEAVDLKRLLHELGVHQVELELQNEQLRQTQAALELSRDRYIALYEHAPVGYVTLGLDGIIVQVNHLASALLAAPAAELLGSRLTDFVAMQDRPRLQQQQRRTLSGEGLALVELRLAPADGATRWVALQMALVPAERDPSPQYRAALVDITERVQMRESMTRLAAIVASSEDAIVSRDMHGRILSWNDAATRLFGYDAEQMLGRTMDELIPQERRAEEARLLQRLRDGEPTSHVESERLARGNVRLPISMSLSPIRDERGETVGSAMIARDISERMRAERALRERMRQLDMLSHAGQTLILGEQGPTSLRSELFERVAAGAGIEIHFNYAVDESAQALVLLSAGGLSDEHRSAAVNIAPDESLCGLVVQRKARLILSALQSSDLPQAQALKAMGARCFAGYPLLAHGRLYGVAAFASTSRDALRDGDLLMIQTVCDQVSAMLDRSQLMEDLHASEQALRRADRAKDDFLATLAHELRNPLAPIRNAIHIMRHSDPAKLQQLAWCRDIIDRQVVQMTHLLEDLLDVSRLTRNRIELRCERVNLIQALDQAMETTQPLMQSQRHEFSVDMPQEPVLLYGDLTRLTQVFANLLNNAAKYTDPGGHIALHVSLEADQVRVSVRDSGIGIDAQQLPKVFEMFAQLEPALERSSGGLGIGLALARGLVDLHGGTMQAFSEGPGRGSEFVVELPLAEAAPQPAPQPALRETSAAPPRRRLLVVDDNVDAAQTLADMLRLHGHEVRTAYGGLEGWRLAQEWQPDVAVLDIGMRDLNGYELCHRIRALPGQQRTVLIACTGWGQHDDRSRARAAGFDFHLVKPIEPAAILALLPDIPVTAQQGD